MATEAALKAAGVTMDWSKAIQGLGGGGWVKGTYVMIDRITLGDRERLTRASSLRSAAADAQRSLF